MDFCSVLNVLTSTVDIVIKISLLMSLVDILTIIFDGIGLNLDKLSECECGYCNNNNNNNNIIIIISNTCEIIIPILVVMGEFLLLGIYFTMHTIDKSSLHLILSIEFELVITVILLLISNLAVQSSVDAAYCDTKVIHNVCVFYSRLFVTITIVNTLYKIRGTFIVGLCLTAIYIMIQVIDGLLINVRVSIKFDVIIVAVNQLALILSVQLSIGAVACDTQRIPTVRVVSIMFFLFFFLCFFFFLCVFGFKSVVSCIQYRNKKHTT